MKRNLKEAGIEYIEVNLDTKAGALEGMKYHVKTLPTFVMFNEKDEPSSYFGAIPVFRLLKLRNLPLKARYPQPKASTGKEQTSGHGEAVSPEKGAK